MKFKVIISNDLKEMIPGYLGNREKDIESLKKHMEEKNFDEIFVIAHKIAGNAGGYGFDELGDIAVEMEKKAKEKKLDDIEISFKKMASYLENLDIEYQDTP